MSTPTRAEIARRWDEPTMGAIPFEQAKADVAVLRQALSDAAKELQAVTDERNRLRTAYESARSECYSEIERIFRKVHGAKMSDYKIINKERTVVTRDGVYVAEFISRDDAEEWVAWKGGEVRETDTACRCCGQAATSRIGSDLATCDYCEDHCRAPGPIDKGWYHDTIEPTTTMRV